MSEHDHGNAASGSLFGDSSDSGTDHSGSGHRAPRRRSGCLPILIVLTLIVVGGFFVVRSLDISNPFASEPKDYAGPGGDAVTFEVAPGDSISVMAQNLQGLDVVASTDAFVEAAKANDKSGSIQQGLYRLKKKMAAADVVSLLVSGETRGMQYTFTAGKTVKEIVDLLARDTEIPRADFEAALKDPKALGLPASADGNPEGYLAPGSYLIFDDTSAASILAQMVTASKQQIKEAGLPAASKKLGYSEHDLVTIASLIQAEGSLLDEQGKAQIARVIYNRLETEGDANPSRGYLALDATIDFIYGDKVARRTFAEIDAVADNPYNTYKQPGLPPGPIATPSPAALKAAVNPAKGPWFYYVTVNLKTGKTKFATTPEEFAVIEAELDAFCDRSPLC